MLSFLRNFDLMEIILRCAALFLVISVHEFSHGFVAYKMGDPTAKNSGRLTLNPLAHFDPLGALCMVLFRFGWAKPVPINPFYFRNSKKGTVLVSLAGPGSNVVFAFVCGIIVAVIYIIINLTFNIASTMVYGILNTLADFFHVCAIMNISFAIFNLIPIPPLDGGKVLGVFLPTSAYMKMLEYERYVFPVLLILSLAGVLGWIVNLFFSPIYSLWFNMVNFIIGLVVK